MNKNTTFLITSAAMVAGAFVAGGVVGGVGLASAADSTPEPTPRVFGLGGPHDHTPVTGSERTKVVDAVTEKYDDVKVVDVRQDPDGSYDVLGTRDGKPVMVQVSKDLKTVELRSAPPRGPGGPCGMGGPDGEERGATPSTGT